MFKNKRQPAYRYVLVQPLRRYLTNYNHHTSINVQLGGSPLFLEVGVEGTTYQELKPQRYRKFTGSKHVNLRKALVHLV